MSSSAASTPAKLASTITNNLSSLASRTLATTSTQAALMQSVKKIIPPLTSTKHKGQAGRIGIVGGSRDYTGAPFFASMSSMRFGCDLSYTICTPEAGNVIKTYSPDLIVNRLLDPDVPWDTVRSNVDALFERFHAVVVGPGLGRDDFMQKCAKLCIQLARKHDMYIVIDADGLWLLQNEPELIQGYTKAVLTPNVAEFARLCTKLNIDHKQDPDNAALALAKALQGPTILEKGKVDRITNGNDQGEVYTVDAEGGLKRCGGQGDILAGCLGTFAGWVKIYEQEHSTTSSSSSSSSRTDNGAGGGGGAAAAAAGGGGGGEVRPDRLLMLAAYGAALTARTCSRLAYRKKGRAMLADDLLPEVGTAYEQLWGDVQAASL